MVKKQQDILVPGGRPRGKNTSDSVVKSFCNPGYFSINYLVLNTLFTNIYIYPCNLARSRSA